MHVEHDINQGDLIYRASYLEITSTDIQEVTCTFYSLGKEKIGTLTTKLVVGKNIVELTHLKFLKNHIYYEIAIRSPNPIFEYKIIRK